MKEQPVKRCERCEWYRAQMQKVERDRKVVEEPNGFGFCHAFPPTVVGTAFLMQGGASIIGGTPKPPEAKFATQSTLPTTPAFGTCRFFEPRGNDTK